MPNNDYDIQELLQRDVYVNDKKVGTIVGERHHPNEARVRSMRIQVDAGVADEFMRKPAELAPLPKELVHSIRTDGTVKLSGGKKRDAPQTYTSFQTYSGLFPTQSTPNPTPKMVFLYKI